MKRSGQPVSLSEGPDDELEDLLQRGFRYALALTHEPDGAADLLQDACLSVLRARGSWTVPYLFRAVRSRFVDQHRRGKLAVIEPVADLEALSPAGDLWDEELEIRADAQLLDRGLELLRTEEREAIFLAVVVGYTAQEIADATNRPRGTVLSLLRRGRIKLRAWLIQSQAVQRS